MENKDIEIKEMGIVFAEDVEELEQAYSELLEALEEISNVYTEAQKPRTEYSGMYYAAGIMAAIADKAIAKSKEKYNE